MIYNVTLNYIDSIICCWFLTITGISSAFIYFHRHLKKNVETIIY